MGDIGKTQRHVEIPAEDPTTAPHGVQALAYLDEDGWWTIKLPELTSPGPNGNTITATGGATTWRKVQRAAEQLAAAWLDVDESAVFVTVDVVIPEDIAQRWREGTKAEEAAREQQERATTLRRGAVRALRGAGYPAEAAAAALGISRQRVDQLDKAATSEAPEKIAS
jgi:ABC-type transport system substrate-binding protein